jgi:hypothetical protein
MDQHQWQQEQVGVSFNSAEYLQRQIQANYGGGSSVHIGFLYCAIGKNHGAETVRYIIVIPFYDPSIHGYNFKVNNPFVYFRGFAGVSNSEYLDELQDDFNRAVDQVPEGEGKNRLKQCAPIAVYAFEGRDLKPLKYGKSEKSPTETLTINDGFFEFWIHGRRDVEVIKYLPDHFSIDKFTELVENAIEKKDYKNLLDYCQQIQTSCNSYSFPTFGLWVKNPMDGHLPFRVKDLRLLVGGIVEATSDDCNEVHVKASISEIPFKIAFARVWDKMFERLAQDIKDKATNKKLRRTLQRMISTA